jgi:hypothetical protein
MSGWAELDEVTIAAMDRSILESDMISAILTVIRVVQPRSLLTAQAIAEDRRAWLRENQPERFPAQPTIEERIESALATLEGTPAAVEAYWDGDTGGWFVVLCIMVRQSSGKIEEIYLGSMRGESSSADSSWAISRGTELAQRLKVPFWFGSPNQQDDADSLRWRAT